MQKECMGINKIKVFYYSHGVTVSTFFPYENMFVQGA